MANFSNMVQPRIMCQESLKEGLSTSGWQIGICVDNCSDYTN